MNALYICATFRTGLNETNRSTKANSPSAMNTLKGIRKQKTVKIAPPPLLLCREVKKDTDLSVKFAAPTSSKNRYAMRTGVYCESSVLKFRFPYIKNWIGYLYYFVVLFETYFNVTVCTVWLFLFYKGSICFAIVI